MEQNLKQLYLIGHLFPLIYNNVLCDLCNLLLLLLNNKQYNQCNDGAKTRLVKYSTARKGRSSSLFEKEYSVTSDMLFAFFALFIATSSILQAENYDTPSSWRSDAV